MSQISSINFKKSVAHQVFHNSTIRPNYAIGGKLECNISGYDALTLKQQIIENAIQAYNKNKHIKAPSFKAKSFEWSAVCNIKPDTTMQDLETLAEHFNKKYGFQCYQIAIHRDEGHINDNGEKVINHHAHLEFITLDKKTGKQCFKMRDFPPSKMRQIQDEVAEILQMQRGQDKRISGAKRIEPRAYAKLKEDERTKERELKREKESLQAELLLQKAQNADLQEKLLSAKEVKSLIENFRKNSIGEGLPKEFYRDLSTLKKGAEPTTEELLKSTLMDLLRNYQEQGSKAQEAELKNQELEQNLHDWKLSAQSAHSYKEFHENKIKNLESENKNLKDEIQEKIKHIKELENKIQTLTQHQKSKLTHLESDLTAKEQKLISSMPKENKIDSMPLLDDLKGKKAKIELELTKEQRECEKLESDLQFIESWNYRDNSEADIQRAINIASNAKNSKDLNLTAMEKECLESNSDSMKELREQGVMSSFGLKAILKTALTSLVAKSKAKIQDFKQQLTEIQEKIKETMTQKTKEQKLQGVDSLLSKLSGALQETQSWQDDKHNQKIDFKQKFDSFTKQQDKKEPTRNYSRHR